MPPSQCSTVAGIDASVLIKAERLLLVLARRPIVPCPMIFPVDNSQNSLVQFWVGLVEKILVEKIRQGKLIQGLPSKGGIHEPASHYRKGRFASILASRSRIAEMRGLRRRLDGRSGGVCPTARW